MLSLVIPVNVSVSCSKCGKYNFFVEATEASLASNQFLKAEPCRNCMDEQYKKAYEKGSASRDSEVLSLKEKITELEARVRRVGLKEFL